ncbi:MAG: SusC/RagA family TonB-linked outer membrane protein [Gemmatimonadetes bacterium]|nr:SusC/RagA family TonB-linked outer membrane protein [Gemmatimonadota bacterium]
MKWTRVVWLSLLLFVPDRGFGQATGTISGTVTGTGNRPLAGAAVAVAGTARGDQTDAQGRFTITAVPAGSRTVRATFAGHTEASQAVTVSAGQTLTVNLVLAAQAVQLEGLVAVGYGTQRREAVTGSVATVSTQEANVGQVTAPTEMIRGRVAGVTVVQNDGSPGAGMSVRIRGGTSISASNEPLYVIDGVPINNAPVEPTSLGQNNSLPRNPLNLINPNDIESMTVLKDASATAIYGSRGANGVVLITTKTGGAGRTELTYDTYMAYSTPSRSLDVLNGQQYRSFIEGEVAAGRLDRARLAGLGTANTNWEDEVLRNAVSQSHNLAFAGGAANTQYRGSLSYTDEQGIVRSSGLNRISGRINASQQALNSRLRLGLNLNAAQVSNDYVAYENTGGFTGTVFTNMLIMNPTNPVTVVDPVTGASRYYEIGPGAVTIRNPVAIAEQIQDDGISRRIIGNMTSDLDILSNLTLQLNLGTDRSDGVRRGYYPKSNPLGATTNGQALVGTIANVTNTLQSYLTLRLNPGVHSLDVLGGYEFNEYSTVAANVEAQGFITDAFGYNNLGAGAVQQPSSSSRIDSRVASFFTRANYNLLDRYFLTGVLRYDGSSRFGSGNKWAVFPAISGAWNIGHEAFMSGSPFSELRLRAGFGINGSQEIDPYSSLITLTPGSRAVFGEQVVIGVAPNRNPNPDLKWEETAQWNLGMDYGLFDNLLSGTLEYYVKNTSDLLLTVPVPQPAVVANRLENIGKIRNRGVEFTLDAQAVSTADLSVVLGLLGSVDRNEVVSLGRAAFITTGSVSGQGQSGQVSQRIMPGFALGTFFGPEFVGVDANGKQLFNKYDVTKDAAGIITSRTLNGQTTIPSANDYVVIGDANPDFTLSGRSEVNWNSFDMSFLVRGVFGQDVLNNTALVYSTKGNALQDKNFLASALDDPTGIREPAIFSSRWIENGSFIRLQNITLGYNVPLESVFSAVRASRVYVSADNLWLSTDYTGYDPEAHTQAGLASRGIDYLKYPNPRTFTAGVRIGF